MNQLKEDSYAPTNPTNQKSSQPSREFDSGSSILRPQEAGAGRELQGETYASIFLMETPAKNQMADECGKQFIGMGQLKIPNHVV
jgi:hypothetical protein